LYHLLLHSFPTRRSSDLMGGEESGGFGFAMHLPERDGIVADLFFLDFMLKTRKTPSALIAELMRMVGPSHYMRRDLHFDAASYRSEEHTSELQSRFDLVC